MTRKSVAGSDRFDIDCVALCNNHSINSTQCSTAQLNPNAVQISQLPNMSQPAERHKPPLFTAGTRACVATLSATR